MSFGGGIAAGAHSDILCVRLKGTRHVALSDLSYLMRGPARREALGDADAELSGQAVARLWLAFLDTHLKGRPRGVITQVLAHFGNLQRHDPQALRAWARRNQELTGAN
jgi:hypothetical protein